MFSKDYRIANGSAMRNETRDKEMKEFAKRKKLIMKIKKALVK